MLTRALTSPLIGTIFAASAAVAQAPGVFPNQTMAAPADPTEFLTQEKAGQWRASKLKGVEIYNNSHQRVGEIRDVLVDRDGKIDAVIIGVGGFLGLDEHDVALRFDQLSWAEPGSRGEPVVPRDSPEHAIVNFSKDQLLGFPEFRYAPTSSFGTR
jgi:sporulation protein YlmC with PRC-barrel domain